VCSVSTMSLVSALDEACRRKPCNEMYLTRNAPVMKQQLIQRYTTLHYTTLHL
jgi:hypothetical protein